MKQECKRVQALLSAFNGLLNNCVDRIGLPKKPTVKKIKKALDQFNKFVKESKINDL